MLELQKMVKEKRGWMKMTYDLNGYGKYIWALSIFCISHGEVYADSPDLLKAVAKAKKMLKENK